MAWRAAFLAVPRHHFLPPQVWVDDEQGKPQPLSRDHDPEKWLESAYRNVPILVQFDDGQTVWPDTGGELCTSSASKPDLVLSMLAALDLHEGHKVLEIGTGTGYNAALWLLDPSGGSWAVAHYDDSLGPRQLRQHGPRRM